jgi:hypothetical protein
VYQFHESFHSTFSWKSKRSRVAQNPWFTPWANDWTVSCRVTLYSFVSVVLAVVACYLLLSRFNLLSGKELGMEVLTGAPFVAALIALVLFVGVIAGSYPAFYLTSLARLKS